MNGSVWIASYVVLWLTMGLVGFAVVALLRQIGVLHTRVAPMGIHFAGEGPGLDEPAPDADEVDYSTASHTVLVFASPTCEICASLKPALGRLARSYREVDFRLVDHDDAPEVFARFRVRSTPYLVAIDAAGVVRSRGVANTVDQVEEMLAEVLAGPPVPARSVGPIASPFDQDADDHRTGDGPGSPFDVGSSELAVFR